MAGEQAWERQRDKDGNLEPNLWYDRFTDYRLMEKPRSLLECVNRWRDDIGRKRTNRRSGTWRRASEKWNWEQRAEAWDKHQRQLKEAKWEQRRDEQEEREWEVAQKLLQRFDKMLAWPLYEVENVQERDSKGRVTSIQIIKPVNWRHGDAVRFAEAASKQARLAAGMETERIEQGGEVVWRIVRNGISSTPEATPPETEADSGEHCQAEGN